MNDDSKVSIKIGDIAYEGGKFYSEYLSDYKPIGVVFAVSPRLMIVHLYERYLDWKDAKDYCKNIEDEGDGWYMPDKEELNEIYKNKDLINAAIGIFSSEIKLSDNFYWSSSSYNHKCAWYQHFGSGNQYYYGLDKNDKGRVRAVRLIERSNISKPKSENLNKPKIENFTKPKSDNLNKPKSEIEFIKSLKGVSRASIKIGDIAYEGGKFCSEYLSEDKPIGIVFAVSPKLMIVHLSEKQLNQASGKTYCKNIKDGGGGWYMPNKNELNTIYVNKNKINAAISKLPVGTKLLDEEYYWSSSFYSNYCAWKQRFSDGYQGNGYRDYQNSVRAVKKLK